MTLGAVLTIAGAGLVMLAPLPFDLVGVLLALSGVGLLWEGGQPRIRDPRTGRPWW